MTVREILKILRKNGWYTTNQEGSHISLKHPTRPQWRLETRNSKQHL